MLGMWISLGIFLVGILGFGVFWLINRRKTKKIDYQSDWLPVKEIRDNLIHTLAGCSAVLRVFPVNYYLLSLSEQESFEYAVMNALRSIEFPVQFFSTVQVVDTRDYAEKLFSIATSEQGVRASYARQLSLVLQEAVKANFFQARKMYLIVTGKDEKEALARANLVAAAFSRARVKTEMLSQGEILDFLYEVLNRSPVFKPSLALKKGVLEEIAVGKGVVVDA